MAFGFSPKHIEHLKTTGLSEKQTFVIAIEAAKKLDWNIGVLSKNGIVAYTKFSMSSWSEEVQIKIEEGNISVKSMCTGSQIMDWGKNKKNTDSFITIFNSIKADTNLEDVESKFVVHEKDFVSEEDDVINKPPLSQKEKVSEFFSFFKPTEGYFIAPILLNINIVIFIMMAISGVNIMLPDNESLILWGANFRPVTLEGEWWRLITSCFLHIGIIHLLLNMYALLYIGLLLEPYLGKSRFLSAYLLTGIAASAASLYWNELTISAGASGAIFGMYGVFLAMLTTNLIEKSARKALLMSIAVFVGYNLLNGLKDGIDNAAHVGGLVSGLIIGYSFYPSLIKPNSPKIKFGIIGVLSLLIVASSFFVLSTTSAGDISKYDDEMEQFVLLEEKALSIYNMPETSSDKEYLDEIRNVGIPNWELTFQLIERIELYELPTEIHNRNLKLKQYCDLRIESYELIYKAISEGTDIYQSAIEDYAKKIELIIQQLSE
jgi:rhomboid protease GluP